MKSSILLLGGTGTLGSAIIRSKIFPNLKHPSKKVYKEVGCHGVAEGSALAAVGESGYLVVPKVKSVPDLFSISQFCTF